VLFPAPILAFNGITIIFVRDKPLLLIKIIYTMNKAELIDAMAFRTGLSKAMAKKAVDAFIDATADSLQNGKRVALVGFGSFSVSKRAARKGRNPQTGKEINIPAKKVVKFKPGAELAKGVN
jgi:DNA-binding protein HU-beta